MSPNVWRSKAAYAVPASCRPASTQLTHESGGSPFTFRARLVQLFPPSRVSWRLPSSVPTQMTSGSKRDSLHEYVVGCSSAEEVSTVSPPDCYSFRYSWQRRVRSGDVRD